MPARVTSRSAARNCRANTPPDRPPRYTATIAARGALRRVCRARAAADSTAPRMTRLVGIRPACVNKTGAAGQLGADSWRGGVHGAPDGPAALLTHRTVAGVVKRGDVRAVSCGQSAVPVNIDRAAHGRRRESRSIWPELGDSAAPSCRRGAHIDLRPLSIPEPIITARLALAAPLSANRRRHRPANMAPSLAEAAINLRLIHNAARDARELFSPGWHHLACLFPVASSIFMRDRAVIRTNDATAGGSVPFVSSGRADASKWPAGKLAASGAAGGQVSGRHVAAS